MRSSILGGALSALVVALSPALLRADATGQLPIRVKEGDRFIYRVEVDPAEAAKLRRADPLGSDVGAPEDPARPKNPDASRPPIRPERRAEEPLRSMYTLTVLNNEDRVTAVTVDTVESTSRDDSESRRPPKEDTTVQEDDAKKDEGSKPRNSQFSLVVDRAGCIAEATAEKPSRGDLPVHLARHLRSILGSGLHAEELEPGKVYALGCPGDGSTASPHGRLHVRFDGIMGRGNEATARFTVLSPATRGPSETGKPTQPEAEGDGTADGRFSPPQRPSPSVNLEWDSVGDAVYRVADGLLERLDYAPAFAPAGKPAGGEPHGVRIRIVRVASGG